ncbi:biotin-dependent carboxyltransferase family protein [Marinimicrobium sp. C6131]|uniref:5-oxoprolinase subunit C family protein n=1 Tax=Marinimicrobium sp. C6131 TaxID=3022676 RepID=UPI00223D9AD7|nr:biotin-dependent carboxyltransferase family protein [Marinimicrobium sp. C6131]UZJ43300.1 biotin-dependent carboxyltransferase family protein [Marinimicrobium sp. C6131]
MTDRPISGLTVIKPGMLTLLQDLGRFGYQHLGLTPGGAADERAFLWANKLLDNSPNSPALEITLGGLILEVQKSTRIALTGADLQASCNGVALANWQTHSVEVGDRLQFGFPRSGVRAYLAVAGGFVISPTFGSVATVVREQMGGIDGRGRPLQEGDCLPCAAGERRMLRRVPPRFIPDYTKPLTVRVLEDQQRTLFDDAEMNRFYASEYRVSTHSDRMGVRLAGPTLHPTVGGIVSEGIPFGAIQVPPSGQPIILLKDRQTIGGYPKLGTAHPLDAFALAQRQPGQPVRFTPASWEGSQDYVRFLRFMHES